MATPYSLYHKYRTVSGGGVHESIDTKHEAFLSWLDDPTSEGGGGIQPEGVFDEFTGTIQKQDSAPMDLAEQTLRTTTGLTEETVSHGLDWEMASLQPADQTIPVDSGFYSGLTEQGGGEQGSLIFEHGMDIDSAYNNYKKSAKAKRDELLAGTSSAMSQMGLLSGTSGQVLRSGEAMKNISADIESASDVAANLSETYELGVDTAEIAFESGIEIAWNTYMDKLDDERVYWSNGIMQSLQSMALNEQIEFAPTISDIGLDIDTPDACECGWDFSAHPPACLPCDDDSGDDAGGGSSGCTDSNANNYDPEATSDDGSCAYGTECPEGQVYENGNCFDSDNGCLPGYVMCPDDAPSNAGQCVYSWVQCEASGGDGDGGGTGGDTIGGVSWEEQFEDNKDSDCPPGTFWDDSFCAQWDNWGYECLQEGGCAPIMGQ